MVKSVFLFLGLILFTLLGKAQVFANFIDSLGYKQGRQIEYRPLPTTIREGGLKTYSADSTVVYIQDLYLYEECSLEKQIGDYENSLREGQWSFFWPDGILRCQLNYSHGIPVGEIITYYRNGTIALRGVISYDLHSKWESYYENGNQIRIAEGSAREILEFLYN